MSGGTWSQADVNNPATRPGAYFNLIAQAVSLVDAGVRGTVAIVGRADWGPIDQFYDFTTEEDVESAYGTGLSVAKLAKQALRGGAATVKVLRIAGGSAAQATLTLNDTVPGAALDLTAKYPGTRANAFTVTVASNPVAGQDMFIYENGVLIEQHTLSTGENDEWATYLNENSDLVTAAVNGTSDRALAPVTNAAFANGDSGSAVVAGDYTDAQELAQDEDFDTIVQDDDTTLANVDAAIAWARDQRDGGNYFILVTGSEAAETLSAARTRASGIDDEGVAYVFPGFTDADGITYTGQEAAARVAGLIASRGISKSVTFARLDDAQSVETKLTNAEIRSGLTSGLLLLTHDGEVVRVEKGINTLVTYTSAKPQTFSKIRTVMTVDEVRSGLEIGFRDMVGQVSNDADGQASIIGAGQAFLDTLINARAVKPGATLTLDPATPSEGDHMFVKVALQPLDSIEVIFTTVYIST